MLCLREASSATLAVLRLRRDEIAGVLVAPLHAFAAVSSHHTPADIHAACAAARTAYQRWLIELREACSRNGLPLIFDETATGFRLAPGGAQDSFGVEADVVCYGRSAGGGLPLGVICGPTALLASTPPRQPLRVAEQGGAAGAAEHPALMAATDAFLRSLDGGAAESRYAALHARVEAWASAVNDEMLGAGLPVRVLCDASTWSLRYLTPSRHHFLLMAYLMAEQDAPPLEWIGPHRLGLPLATSEATLRSLHAALVAAARAMVADGWWAPPDGEVQVRSEAAIRRAIISELGVDVAARLVACLRSLCRSLRA